jgi:hypothetical protein
MRQLHHPILDRRQGESYLWAGVLLMPARIVEYPFEPGFDIF